MEFGEFFPEEASRKDKNDFGVGKSGEPAKIALERINQEQLYDILTSQEASWQAIIYELMQTEQLDPWDIDIASLAQKYLKKIREMEEANFFISSKVLLAASLLLRIKSEILLNKYIKSLDEILFGKKETLKYEIERIEIDEGEIPELVPKTPLPRFRQVSLDELMAALGRAINTEGRRIRKEIYSRQAEKLSQIDIPKTRINIRDRIRKIYARIITYFHKKPRERIGFTELVGNSREEKLAAFLPLLHLDTQQKVWLEQEKHFDEIWIWLYEIFSKKQQALERTEQEIERVGERVEEESVADREQKRRLQKINKDFSNPLANFFEMIE